MKQILVVGKCDKTDLMLYLSKVIATDFKLLLVEVSQNRNYEYCFPKVDSTLEIHQHDQFDVVENIKDYSALESFLEGKDYEFVFVDIDDEHALLNWPMADAIYLVTSYENPVLQNNKKLIDALHSNPSYANALEITKVICEAAGTFQEDYINELFGELSVIWKPALVYYPEERNQTLKILNQNSSSISIKKLSGEYKKVIKQMVSDILESESSSVNALWKRAERRK